MPLPEKEYFALDEIEAALGHPAPGYDLLR